MQLKVNDVWPAHLFHNARAKQADPFEKKGTTITLPLEYDWQLSEPTNIMNNNFHNETRNKNKIVMPNSRIHKHFHDP